MFHHVARASRSQTTKTRRQTLRRGSSARLEARQTFEADFNRIRKTLARSIGTCRRAGIEAFHRLGKPRPLAQAELASLSAQGQRIAKRATDGRQRRSTGVHHQAGRGKRCNRRVARLARAHRNSRGYSRPRNTMPTAARAAANQRSQISTRARPDRRHEKKVSSIAPAENWPHPRPSPAHTRQAGVAGHGRAGSVNKFDIPTEASYSRRQWEAQSRACPVGVRPPLPVWGTLLPAAFDVDLSSKDGALSYVCPRRTRTAS